MIDFLQIRARKNSSGLPRLTLPLLLVAATGGCAAMEGVNVGVNVPVGGVVNVGANKTIGDTPSSTPTQQQPRTEPDETASEEDQEE